jgi:large subunit ribosomal protein L32e
MKKPVTTATEKALQLRERVKKKKPNFVRSEGWRYKRLGEGWRRPRGLDNKMRRKIKGWPPTVNVGYRGPKIARGLHPSGYKEVLVYNIEGLKQVDPKTQAVKIAHTVGKRKRARILVEARKKKIAVLNPREAKKGAEEEKELTKETEEEKVEEDEVEEEAETEEPEQKQKKKRKGRARKQ